MLEHLEIKNYALIENLTIDFHEGFNVITGETGAGKSIILGALGLLMGEKADASSIRTGAQELSVNAIISVPQNHEVMSWLKEHDALPEDGTIIVKRSVKESGRSVISVQGQLLSRAELTFLADSLIDMHGQSEHQSLLLSDRQRKIVDNYAQNKNLLDEIKDSCHKIGELTKQKEELENQIEDAKKQQDYLSFALEEIESAKLEQDEDQTLKEKVLLLSQFETIYENLSNCTEKLKELKSIFYDASTFLTKAAKCDPKLCDFCSRLESDRIESEDIAMELRDYLNSVNYSEDAINMMQERLSLIQKLKRKYGQNLNQVIAFGQDAKNKLAICKNSTEVLDLCQRQLNEEKSKYNKFSEKLYIQRKKASEKLEKQIEQTLRTLGMPNAKFAIDVMHNSEKINFCGGDGVSFLISANPGEPLKEIKEIASGGELSRVMLALKAVLAQADSIQTQVFDEVDSGIGGSVALNLATCIQGLSKQKQVIAITHLATIASKADSQFVVTKTVSDGRTYSHLKQVEGEDRVLEIARMLSGDESDVTVNHAKVMLGY